MTRRGTSSDARQDFRVGRFLRIVTYPPRQWPHFPRFLSVLLSSECGGEDGWITRRSRILALASRACKKGIPAGNRKSIRAHSAARRRTVERFRETRTRGVSLAAGLDAQKEARIEIGLALGLYRRRGGAALNSWSSAAREQHAHGRGRHLGATLPPARLTFGEHIPKRRTKHRSDSSILQSRHHR
jgi:hypothetical protein